MLEQRLKLEPSISILCERAQLRLVGWVVRERAVEEPVGPREVLGRVIRRLDRPNRARGSGDCLVERGLRVKGGDFGRIDAILELLFEVIDDGFFQ